MKNLADSISRQQEAKTKAETIVSQIRPMTRMACGWRQCSYTVGGENNTFDVQITAFVLRGQSHFLRITLELNDVYTVERCRIPTARAKDQSIRVEERHENVYCDVLDEVVYRAVNK
jgi:hypothetical protein